MRNFILVGHRAMTTPQFSLNDLPGSGGRMDILARAINSAFFLSHDIRRNVEVALVMLGPEDPPKTIRFCGKSLKYLNPNERSTGAMIRNALVKYSALKGDLNISHSNTNNSKSNPLPNEIRSSPGIYISRNGLIDVIKHFSTISYLVYLHESGKDILTTELGGELTFILSDDTDLTPEEEEIIKQYSSETLSVGPKALHTDHCMCLIHNALDRINNL